MSPHKDYPDCDLCDLAHGVVITRKYYENKVLIIIDCLTCEMPMLVFKHHAEAREDERRQAENIINQLFDYTLIRKKVSSRKIKNHERWHIMGAKFKYSDT